VASIGVGQWVRSRGAGGVCRLGSRVGSDSEIGGHGSNQPRTMGSVQYPHKIHLGVE
jgi:hypothetical protein